jgi:hypothetical protein
MKPYIESGQKFNRLTAVKRIFRSDNRNTYWLFRCDCGEEKEIVSSNVVNWITKSCGCLQRERTSRRNISHGFIKKFKKGNKNPRFYAIWSGMRNRCQNKNNSEYCNYGARGISVDEKWNTFSVFYKDMWDKYVSASKRHGEKNISIDRINTKGNYCKENCRWATAQQQARNKTNNTKCEFNGENLCLAEILEKNKVDRAKYYRRRKKGWGFEDTINKLQNSSK